MKISRKDWPRALATQSRQQLESLLNEITSGWQIEPVQLPDSGLAMLQLRDSALKDAYNLGEIPLTLAWVEITTEEGVKVQGATQLMDDDVEKVEFIAICDAVLAQQLAGWEAVYRCVESGMLVISEQEKIRANMLTKTRVDFELLNASEEDDD